MILSLILILNVKAQGLNSTVTTEITKSQSETAIDVTTVPTTAPTTTLVKPTQPKSSIFVPPTSSITKALATSNVDTPATTPAQQSQTTTQPSASLIPSVAAVSSSDTSSSSNSFVVIYVFTGFLISAFVATGFAFFLIRRKENDRKLGRVLALEEQQVNSDKTIYDDKTIRSEAYDQIARPSSPAFNSQAIQYSNVVNPYQTGFEQPYYEQSYYQGTFQPYEMYTMNPHPLPAYPPSSYLHAYNQMPVESHAVYSDGPEQSKAEQQESLQRPPSKLQKALSKINTNADDKILSFDMLLNELNDTAEILSPESLNSAPFEFTHYNLPSADGIDPVIRQTSIDDLALYSEYYTTPRNPHYRVSIADTSGYTFFMRESKDSASRIFKTSSRMSIDTVITRKSMRMSRYDTLRSRLSLKPKQSLQFKSSVATLATEVDPTE
ncbi:hypothetical protein HDV06_006823 [Boothiomyces sp. JEL0866]|nr:hypothetical protein HDV06_006823 [Boothiomyces sp. JEL0866]